MKDVKLPAWSKNEAKKHSAYKFVKMMRGSLESKEVSRQLHLWIDLIFGCKDTSEGRPYFSGHCNSTCVNWKERKERCTGLQRESLD